MFKQANYTVLYFGALIEAADDRDGLLAIATSSYHRVWWNGGLIDCPDGECLGDFDPDAQSLPVRLCKGTNHLVIKSAHLEDLWYVCARLKGTNGQLLTIHSHQAARVEGSDLKITMEAIDCARWGFVVTADASHNTLVDCRGGDLHFQCYGFIDVEGAGPGNSLVRCRSPNSSLVVQQFHQDVVGCVASTFVAEHAGHPRILGCTTAGGVLRACEVRDDRFVMPGRESPMLGFNRVFLGGASQDHSLSVICFDGLGLAVDNVVYGFDDGKRRSTEALLHGVRVRDGTQQTWGQWKKQLDQFAKPYYLRAHFDFQDFKRSKP